MKREDGVGVHLEEGVKIGFIRFYVHQNLQAFHFFYPPRAVTIDIKKNAPSDKQQQKTLNSQGCISIDNHTSRRFA